MNEKWWESDWYKEWLRLAKRDYHGKRCGWWYCYIDKDNKLRYIYIERKDHEEERKNIIHM